jgi:hypothetical protein
MSWSAIDAELIAKDDVVKIVGDDKEITVIEVTSVIDDTVVFPHYVKIRGTCNGQTFRAVFDKWELILRKD